MRYLVIGDVHSNLEALEAVLRASAAQKWEAVVVLGDLVGYGADPNAVVDRIRTLNPVGIVRGNHDKVAVGLEDAENFNSIAKTAAEWTSRALNRGSFEYLRALPAGPQLVNDELEICHGSPFDEDSYVVTDLDAARSLAVSRLPLCLFAHTHVALLANLAAGKRLEMDAPHGRPEHETTILAETKYLINPGSVGQPRDGDSRAAYAIVDTNRKMVTLSRVAYPIEAAQKKIVEAGLPPMLAYRLGMGR